MSAAKKRGLGKGLSALMADEYSSRMDEAAAEGGAPYHLPVKSLVAGKYQPRRKFADEAMEDLVRSVKKNGVMQPILVREKGQGKYEIIAGERRFRAAQEVGLAEIPAIVKSLSDEEALEFGLIENIQREDLSPIEEASGYQRLMDEFGYTQEQLAATVGKSRSHVANLLRLQDLPDAVKALLEQEEISMGHARVLIGVENAEGFAREIIKKGLNVRQTEKLIREGIPEKAARSRIAQEKKTVAVSAKDPDILALEETLSESLGLKVGITDRGNSGEITITYESLEQLDEILRKLGGGG